MEIKEFKTRDGSRELMVKYVCQRCGEEDIKPFEQQLTDDGYGYLHNLRCPGGWKVLNVHGPLLCPDCYKAYVEFMDEYKEKKNE